MSVKVFCAPAANALLRVEAACGTGWPSAECDELRSGVACACSDHFEASAFRCLSAETVGAEPYVSESCLRNSVLTSSMAWSAGLTCCGTGESIEAR